MAFKETSSEWRNYRASKSGIEEMIQMKKSAPVQKDMDAAKISLELETHAKCCEHAAESLKEAAEILKRASEADMDGESYPEEIFEHLNDDADDVYISVGTFVANIKYISNGH